MPTITVRLDKDRARLIARWAKHRKITKSGVIRELIDRGAKIETGDDLIAWIGINQGKGLGFKQRSK